jgi:hypothetical protein
MATTTTAAARHAPAERDPLEASGSGGAAAGPGRDAGAGSGSPTEDVTVAERPADGAASAAAGRRGYAKWSPEEERLFFAGLKACEGGAPDRVCAEIARLVGSRDRGQVRDYYYRLIKRINRVLDPAAGGAARLEANARSEHQNRAIHKAMGKFWEVVSVRLCCGRSC